MAGGHSGKPYSAIIGEGQAKEELASLPAECLKILTPHLKPSTPPDLIHDMIVCYYEAKAETPKNVSYTVNSKIRELQKRNNQEYGMRFKMLSLDQGYYDSDRPLIEYFNPENY